MCRELRHKAALYRRILRLRLRSQVEYRASFVARVVGSGLVSVLDFIAIVFVFEHLTAFGSWTFGQVAVLYGLGGLSFRLCDFFVGHLDTLHLQIKDGSFDAVLIRPMGTLFQALSADVALRKVGQVLQALVVLAIGLSQSHVHWTPLRALLLVVAVPAGTVIYASIWIVGAASTFWTVDAMEATNAFTYGGEFLTEYPINVYAAWLRGVLAFASGLAFVAYFPAIAILGRDDPLGLPTFLQWSSPAVALGAAALAGSFWRVAVRHYRSTGS